MKIALYDVDSHNFPNLPLMKLSAYWKAKGAEVEFWRPEGDYDVAYISKIFTESKDPEIHNAIIEERGGSGYDLQNKLPPEVEHMTPDYSLYPQYNFAIGWLTRGCPRCNHTFCITPRKDGCNSIKVADLSEFWTGQKNIVLLDQNILACKGRMDLLQQLANSGARVEFNGGMDARFLNDEIIDALRKINVKDYHFAGDDPREDLGPKFKLFRETGLASDDQTTVYVLTNYWSTLEDDLRRIYALREIKFMPYVMVYDKQKYVDDRGRWLPDVHDRYTTEQLQQFKTIQHLQRWCNHPSKIIKTIPRFEDYGPYKRWVEKGRPV